MQSSFTALQGAIHGLTKLNQKFEQKSLNKYIIKMAQVQKE